MENENDDSLDKKVERTVRTFEGIATTFNGLIRPPNDLGPSKRGACVCLGIGTLGTIVLAFIQAPWYAFIGEVVLAVGIAILLMLK